tara:strand:+ start:666 stop:1037 length:372 start_codon:yes stop_codon:yes gene_type:complete
MCFSTKRQLLDALRQYLKEHESSHIVELKYINWFYRDIEEDTENVVSITDDEKYQARTLLKEKNLDGLFYLISVGEEGFLSYTDAIQFRTTFNIVKKHIQGRFLDSDIICHIGSTKHTLQYFG